MIEVRLPDSLTNPYLNFALVLIAGLQGIEENLDLPKNADRPVASSLKEAKELVQTSQLIEQTLHPDLVNAYLAVEEEC